MNSDSGLLKRARGLDRAALGEIYKSYSPGVFGYAVRLLGDRDVAEECVAETFSRFLKVLRNGGGPQDYLKAYLYQMAHHWITDYYRRQPPAPFPLDDDLPDRDDEPEQLATDNIDREKVRRALLRLTPEQQQVMVLKYLEGWENEAVAMQLGKTVGSIKALQHRALEALQQMLLPVREHSYE